MIGHHAVIGATARVAGAAAAWTPASLGADLLTWNPHTNLPTSGSVDSWADEGPSGIATLTSSLTARPTAGVEANGLRCINLNGTSNYMTFAGNPFNAQPFSVDLLATAIAGLGYVDPTFAAEGVVLGAGSGLDVHTGFAAEEQHGFAITDFGTAADSVGCYWRGNPRHWMGGTSSVPFTSLNGATTFTSATDQIPTGEWFSYVLYLPATSAAKVMINSRANVVMQATSSQNVPVLVQHLGAVYQPGTASIGAFFKGRLSEFFGANASAANDATIDQMFAYLNALKPA